MAAGVSDSRAVNCQASLSAAVPQEWSASYSKRRPRKTCPIKQPIFTLLRFSLLFFTLTEQLPYHQNQLNSTDVGRKRSDSGIEY